jgi:hypothetical protein
MMFVVLDQIFDLESRDIVNSWVEKLWVVSSAYVGSGCLQRLHASNRCISHVYLHIPGRRPQTWAIMYVKTA